MMAFQRFVLMALIVSGAAIISYMVFSRLGWWLAWGFTQGP